MKCPECGEIASMSFEGVKRKDNRDEPYVYAVVCFECEAPLHFCRIQEYQFGNLVNQVKEVATALRCIPDASEKLASQ